MREQKRWRKIQYKRVVIKIVVGNKALIFLGLPEQQYPLVGKELDIYPTLSCSLGLRAVPESNLWTVLVHGLRRLMWHQKKFLEGSRKMKNMPTCGILLLQGSLSSCEFQLSLNFYICINFYMCIKHQRCWESTLELDSKAWVSAHNYTE